MEAKYCPTCGEHEDTTGPDHVCPFADDDPFWCEYCGAELMDTGSCDNDHREEEED